MNDNELHPASANVLAIACGVVTFSIAVIGGLAGAGIWGVIAIYILAGCATFAALLVFICKSSCFLATRG